jgi:hypothetical protein
MKRIIGIARLIALSLLVGLILLFLLKNKIGIGTKVFDIIPGVCVVLFLIAFILSLSRIYIFKYLKEKD